MGKKGRATSKTPVPRIYFYKLTADNGGAPCVEDGLLSLAICKPMIPSTAEPEDLIFGFAANSLHGDNRLIYIARIGKKLRNGDYYREKGFGNRSDRVYKWRRGRFAWRQGALHHGPKDLLHDLGQPPNYEKANVLLSTDFRYFGASGTAEYKSRSQIVKKAVEQLGHGHRLGKIVEDLTGRRVRRNRSVHLDPDLRRTALERGKGWRPLFGQAGAAATHLCRYGVTVGDLFLFFGWFREAEIYEGSYRYKPDALDLHVIYGWLQVGAIITLTAERQFAKFRWADYHPHFYFNFGTVYIAGDRLELPGARYNMPAAGYFEHFDHSLQLTAPGSNNRGVWQLPGWFYPRNNQSPLSYHPDVKAFTKKGNQTILRSAGRGQEFILNTAQYPEAIRWARLLITSAA